MEFIQNILKGEVADTVIEIDDHSGVLADEKVTPLHVEISELVELVEILLAHLAQDDSLEVWFLVN